MTSESKRGQSAALAGLVLHLMLAGLMLIVALGSGTSAAAVVFLMLAGTAWVWAITAVLFYCRHMAELETMEIDEIARGDERGIFADEARELRLAERRLRTVLRFVVPTFTLLLAGYLTAGAALLFPGLIAPPVVTAVRHSALTWAFCCLGGSFVAFLYSRYALGMASDTQWRWLRAGGGVLSVASLVTGLLCVSMFLADAQIDVGLRVLPYVVTILMGLLGVELLGNFILDFYRPRTGAAECRPSFDSRLVNLMSEPGSIAHSIAEALNYQFGFEVSGTWFYKLLQKTLVPLLIFGIIALLAVSSIIVVQPGRQAVVLTWGRPSQTRAVLGAGIHFKWPWPAQTVEVIDTGRIRRMTIGVGALRPAEAVSQEIIKGLRLYLWTVEHGDYEEYSFLVARSYARASVAQDTETVPMPETDAAESKEYASFGLMRLVMDLHYRVTDAYKFLYGVADAPAVLKAMGNRELTRYAARRDVDGLMSAGREKVSREIAATLGEAIRQADLGVELVLLAPQGIHPPTEVADAFEEVIKADRERVGKELRAQTEAQEILSQTAGSSTEAVKLAEIYPEARRRDDLDAAQAAEVRRTVDELFDRAGGKVKSIINAAQAWRWKRVNEERGEWVGFREKLVAYKAAPNLYMLTEKLKVLADSFRDTHKYVLGIDLKNLEVRYNDASRTTLTGGVGFGE